MPELTYENMLVFVRDRSAAHLHLAEEALSVVPPNQRVVHLVGSENNMFLKLVAKRCLKLGIYVNWHYPRLEEHRVKASDPVIYDSGDKSLRPRGSIMGRELDLPEGPHPTAVSQSIAEVLRCVKKTTGYSTVTIIGRGNATYQLPRLLIEDDWSVTQLHSKSPAHAYHLSEVYVNTAPQCSYPLQSAGLILNIGGAVENMFRSALLFERIGPLTVANTVHNIAVCLEDNHYQAKYYAGGYYNDR